MFHEEESKGCHFSFKLDLEVACIISAQGQGVEEQAPPLYGGIAFMLGSMRIDGSINHLREQPPQPPWLYVNISPVIPPAW